MAGNLSVFVSSTCHDLFQERPDLAKRLTELGHHAIVSELPGTIPVDPNPTTFDACLTVIEKLADVVLVVVKDRYGSADDTGVSITRKEHRRARQLKRLVFVCVHRRTQDLYHSWLANKSGRFPPAEDNRVFEFVEQAYRSRRWLFAYDNVDDVANTLKYQLSAMLKSLLAVSTDKALDPVARAVRKVCCRNRVFQKDGVDALVEYGATGELLELLGHRRPDLRDLTAKGLVRLKTTEAIPYLIDGLRVTGVRRKSPVIRDAETLLAEYGVQAVEALLGRAPNQIGLDERRRWLEALKRLADRRTVRQVLQRAQSAPWLLEAALTSGRRLTKRDAVPAIEAYVTDAKKSLIAWKCAQVSKWMSALETLLETQANRGVYESAIRSLEETGGENAATILESVWHESCWPSLCEMRMDGLCFGPAGNHG